MTFHHALPRIILLALLLLAYIPILKANYEGFAKLPGQIAFVLVLALPAILFTGAAGWFPSVWMVLIPGALALVLQGLVLQTYFESTSSTTAIVLYLIPVGQTLIFVVTTPIVWAVLKFQGG